MYEKGFELLEKELKKAKLRWRQMSEEEKMKYLENLENAYHNLLVQLGKQMVELKQTYHNVFDIWLEILVIKSQKDWKRFEEIFL